MYKRLFGILLLSFLIIGAANAADFKINEGFEQWSDVVFQNKETGIEIYTWDYDDELIRESYLQNSTDYTIVQNDDNTYNMTYDFTGQTGHLISYMTTGNVTIDHGVLEVAEYGGEKYIFVAYKEEGTNADWEPCHEELIKFNELNNIEPIADAI